MPDFSELRRQMVQRYRRSGYIKSDSMAEAIMKVPREEFMDPSYVDYAYVDQLVLLADNLVYHASQRCPIRLLLPRSALYMVILFTINAY